MSQTRCSLCMNAIAEYGLCDDCTDRIEKLTMAEKAALVAGGSVVLRVEVDAINDNGNGQVKPCDFPSCGPLCKRDCEYVPPPPAEERGQCCAKACSCDFTCMLDAGHLGECDCRSGPEHHHRMMSVSTGTSPAMLHALERIAAAVELLSENLATVISAGRVDVSVGGGVEVYGTVGSR
jgi:hypothetical protein